MSMEIGHSIVSFISYAYISVCIWIPYIANSISYICLVLFVKIDKVFSIIIGFITSSSIVFNKCLLNNL